VELVFLCTVLGLAGLAFRKRPDPTRRRLAKIKPTPAAELLDGTIATVRGTVGLVEPGADLSSPISRRQCVYWRVTFDELGIGGDYVELGRSDQGRPFLVTSDAGVARIVLEHARIAVPGSVSLYAMADLENAQHNDAAIRLARTVCKRPNYPQSSSLRVTELIVAPDMVVTVRGYCTREPDPRAADSVTGYRAELPMRPVLSGTQQAPLLLCDYRDYRRVSDQGQ
jgi:hypothetical protein